MDNLKFEFEGTSYDVPCMPERDWKWMLDEFGYCKRAFVFCFGKDCCSCIYSRGDLQSARARKAFYYQCFPEEAPKEKPSCENCKNYSSKEAPKKELPKLTKEVFNRKECPKWARWAAVDMYGNACWYRICPVLSKNVGESWTGSVYELIDGKWDATNWKHSAIEKPVYSGYRVIAANELVILEEKVEKYLEKGWRPLGGVTQADRSYLQALVKD